MGNRKSWGVAPGYGLGAPLALGGNPQPKWVAASRESAAFMALAPGLSHARDGGRGVTTKIFEAKRWGLGRFRRFRAPVGVLRIFLPLIFLSLLGDRSGRVFRRSLTRLPVELGELDQKGFELLVILGFRK